MKKGFTYGVILMLVLMVLCMTGCTNAVEVQTETRPEALAIVVGNHACSKQLNLEYSQISERVAKVIEEYGFISVVSVDGSPSLAAADSYDIPEQYKGADKVRLQADAQNKAHDLMIKIHEIKADDEEVDTLESLRIAVNSLTSAPGNAKKTIVLIDTGFSTTGLLNFSNNLIYGESEAIAELLNEKKAIPNLENIEIVWSQLGDVTEPQQALSPLQRQKLEDIWRAIIQKGGGSCTFYYPEMVGGDGMTVNKELPMVTTVDLQEEEPVRLEADKIEEVNFEDPVFFSEEQIQFLGDSDRYVEPEKAIMAIEPVAEYMKRKEEFRLLLIGTTAGDEDSAYVRELSFARANAVKNSLIDLGISEERIVALGWGNQDKWHLGGVGTSGELAAQNRKVVLLDGNTEEALEIISAIPK